MAHRYKIRAFESPDSTNELQSGATVAPMERSFALLAASLDEAERLLCENVRKERLLGGRVYQICPQIGNPEPIRSIAICPQAKPRRVLLESENGIYSERRRLRFAEDELHC